MKIDKNLFKTSKARSESKLLIMLFKLLGNTLKVAEMVCFQACSLTLWAGFMAYDTCTRYLSRKELRQQREQLKQTQNYEEWKRVATRLDEITGHLGWRFVPQSSHYDYKYIQGMKFHLEDLLEQKRIEECATLLRALMSRDFSGITNQNLYNKTLSGTKELIDDYHNTILLCLQTIADSDMKNKAEFFTELKHFYGRTGLVFSGGASVGMFHLGVISTLLEFDFLPKIFCGASAGSLICALVGTNNDEELRFLARNNFTSLNFDAFSNIPKEGSFFRKIKRACTEGFFIDKEPLQKFLIDNTYNLTFKEAYQKTGRIINITVTDSHHRKFHILNYLTAPEAFVWSAALASCSLPLVYAPSMVYRKGQDDKLESWMPKEHAFIDGSIGADVPVKSLGVMFNVTNFIVSQVNVFVVPFISYSRFHRYSRNYFFIKIWEACSGFVISEIKHRLSQIASLGLIPRRLSLLINVVMQEYFGNINILPNIGFNDITRLFDNPSVESVREWTLRGRNATFFSNLTRP